MINTHKVLADKCLQSETAAGRLVDPVGEWICQIVGGCDATIRRAVKGCRNEEAGRTQIGTLVIACRRQIEKTVTAAHHRLREHVVSESEAWSEVAVIREHLTARITANVRKLE